MNSSSNAVTRSELYSLLTTMFVLLAVAPTAATSGSSWFRPGFEALMVAGALWYAVKLWMLRRRATDGAA
jgi:hypothetical protein